MMDKLITHIIGLSITIGRKALFFFGIFFLIILPFSCDLFRWDEQPDYNYLISIKNETIDTLLISINGGFISIDDFKGNIIYPNTSTTISNSGIMEGDDPIVEALSDWHGLVSCWLYKIDGDSIKVINHHFNRLYYPDRENLVATWDAPFRYMGDSINHFFNYNSWESWLEEVDIVGDGIVQFTIYESDLKGD